MLDITVGILSYNRAIYLREAIISVFEQTRQPQKITIYDNGSHPIVFKTIEDLIGNKVEWVGSENNKSFIWNFNRALENTKTEYVMFLHDDDRLCPEFLAKQVELMNDHLDWVALSCNGFIIDKDGHRNNKTLMPNNLMAPIEIYKNSGDIALKYAGNSCVPFSPTIYRTTILKSVSFREDFSKVVDAVLFCDLAEKGIVACQIAPLYECRIHTGQDSSYFDYSLMVKLDNFFECRSFSDNREMTKVKRLLSGSRSIRKIKLILRSIKTCDYSGLKNSQDNKKIIVSDLVVVLARYFSKKIESWLSR